MNTYEMIESINRDRESIRDKIEFMSRQPSAREIVSRCSERTSAREIVSRFIDEEVGTQEEDFYAEE